MLTKETKAELCELIKNDQVAKIQALNEKRNILETEIKKIGKEIELRTIMSTLSVNWEPLAAQAPLPAVKPEVRAPTRDKRNISKHLTASEVDARLERYYQGMTLTEMARAEGRTITSVRDFLFRRNLQPNKPGLKPAQLASTTEAPKRHKKFKLTKTAEYKISGIFDGLTDWTPQKTLVSEVARVLTISKASAYQYIYSFVRVRSYIEKRGSRRFGVDYRIRPDNNTHLIDGSDPIRMDHLARIEATHSAMT